MKIAVVGAGWYGCHIALTLLRAGHEVVVYEKSDHLLSGASGNNQYRLHMGYHYPRSRITREQSRDGFNRFVQEYPDLSAPVPQNIYAIANSSCVDFDTYCQIMSASKLPVISCPTELSNIEGAIRVDERLLLTSVARTYFGGLLEVRFGSKVFIEHLHVGVRIDTERFDVAVDATWGHTGFKDIYFEPTLLLYYEGQGPAYTMVDGPLCSLYPTEDGRFTLSSVRHTPLGRFDYPAEVEYSLSAKRNAMESEISEYLPGFRDTFKFSGVQHSMKTKLPSASDSRSCKVIFSGHVFHVLSGKIDAMFYAADEILRCLSA